MVRISDIAFYVVVKADTELTLKNKSLKLEDEKRNCSLLTSNSWLS